MPKSKKVICEAQGIIDTLEAIDNNDDKVQYIQNTLDSCVTKTGKTGKKTKTKTKRAMNGWNCYLKTCNATGMPFPECMTDTPRKDKEYTPKKDYWKEQAKLGCQ